MRVIQSAVLRSMIYDAFTDWTSTYRIQTKPFYQQGEGHPCKLCIIICIIYVIVNVLLAPYLSQSTNSLNQNHFQTRSTNMDDTTFRAELQRPLNKARRFAPNNLPHFPGPFLGRIYDVNNVTQLLLSSQKSVHIVGLPAVGKSRLAVHVGYEMASGGVAVRYINVDDSHIFKSHGGSKPSKSTRAEHHGQKPTQALAISKVFTDITLSWYSHTETRFVSTTAQGLIEWAKGLSNATILILDNCDTLLQESNTFLKVVDALSKASRYLNIITTSRLKVNLLSIKQYKLKPLDNESAVELLQLVSPIMTLNDSRTINDLLDGIPLALKIIGSLVSEIRPPNLIIRELQRNIIETITPKNGLDTEKMRHVLRLSFQYVDNASQECALYLSHFPGSFSEDAGLHILTNCTNSTPVECLRNLTDLSLIDAYSYAGQSRYQFTNLSKNICMMMSPILFQLM